MKLLAAAAFGLGLGVLLGQEITMRHWRRHYVRLQQLAARCLESLSRPR